jgi:hypothetical protein
MIFTKHEKRLLIAAPFIGGILAIIEKVIKDWIKYAS